MKPEQALQKAISYMDREDGNEPAEVGVHRRFKTAVRGLWNRLAGESQGTVGVEELDAGLDELAAKMGISRADLDRAMSDTSAEGMEMTSRALAWVIRRTGARVPVYDDTKHLTQEEAGLLVLADVDGDDTDRAPDVARGRNRAKWWTRH